MLSQEFITKDNILLDENQNSFWSTGQQIWVEFFENEFHLIKLFESDDPTLILFLQMISEDHKKIAIDFEWKPDWCKESKNKIAIIQIGTDMGAAIIRLNKKKTISTNLRNFLQNNVFIGKGIENDIQKIYLTFGIDFHMKIEDIAQTELIPQKKSLNFIEMVSTFYKNPVINFKNKKISISNWEQKNLNKIQVIYAAFDVIGLYEAYKNMSIFIY